MKLGRNVTESWEFIRRDLESDQRLDGARIGIERPARNKVGEDPRAMGGDNGQPSRRQQGFEIGQPEPPWRRIGR